VACLTGTNFSEYLSASIFFPLMTLNMEEVGSFKTFTPIKNYKGSHPKGPCSHHHENGEVHKTELTNFMKLNTTLEATILR
jgi:hypothetical protein